MVKSAVSRHAAKLRHTAKFQLQNKLLIWFLALSIIPSAFIALISYRNSTSALSDQLRNTRLAQAKALGSQVDRFIDERIKDLDSLTKQAVYAQALSNVLGNGIVGAYYSRPHCKHQGSDGKGGNRNR